MGTGETLRLLFLAFLLVATTVLCWRTATAYRAPGRRHLLDVLDRTVSRTRNELERQAGETALVAAWRQIPTPEYPPGLAIDLRPIYRLWSADPSLTTELFRLAHGYVAVVNNPLCEAIDNRWIYPADLVRKHPALHKRLLAELPLVVPYVWVNSAARTHGQGRFGYRVARLNDILLALRALNSSPHLGLVDAMRVDHDGQVFLDEPPVGRLGRIKARLRVALLPPRINTASKLRQERWRDHLAQSMGAYGLPLADLSAVKADKAW